jgi:GDP-L-fucose synthase
MHSAKQKGAQSFPIWGTGAPRREFIYSGDLAEACILVMNQYENQNRSTWEWGSTFPSPSFPG